MNLVLTRLHGKLLRGALAKELRVVSVTSTIRTAFLGTEEIPNGAGAIYQMTHAGFLSLRSTGHAGQIFELTPKGEAEALKWPNAKEP